VNKNMALPYTPTPLFKSGGNKYHYVKKYKIPETLTNDKGQMTTLAEQNH
jgi:hypothetical protein